MENTINNIIIEPSLYSCDNIIIEINKEFIDFTGFTMNELLGKSLVELGAILKINSQILLQNISSKYSGYIFTKSLSAREVNISLSHNMVTNKKMYTFVEKTNSRLSDKLIFVEHSFIDNISGVAVYSIPDLILLKTNQKYLEFMASPFNKEENSLGSPINEIIAGFIGSPSEDIWNTVVETQKPSYTKEFEFTDPIKGITYWDFTKIPIFENGNIKYIYEISIEITEKIFKNRSIHNQSKMIEQQKEQLEDQNTRLINIIENLSEGIMIADNKGKIIMTNLEAQRLFYQSDKVIDLGEALKNAKAFDMKGNEIPFKNFPSIRALNGEIVKNAKIFVSHPNKEYFEEISSIPIYNTNGDLTMAVSCFHDITETIEQSKKIEEQKNLLEAIIENIVDSITIFDNKGQHILLNKSARELYFPSSEYTGKIGDECNQSEFYNIHGDKIDLENIPARVISGEKFKNMRLTVKSPNKTLEIDVSGTPIYDNEGKFTLGVLCSRDMTDYFKHEEAIRNRNEFLNRIIDTLGLPVIRLSCPDLKIVDINKKAFSFIKLLLPNVQSINQIKNDMTSNLFELLNTSEYCLCISDMLKDKKTKFLNKQSYFVNENEIYWNVIFEPLLDVNGGIEEILILIIDVTNEIKSNIVMEKALKSQGELLVNISHELKTPLNVIFATAQLFNMYCESGSLDDKKNSIVKYIDSIKQNSYRLSKIINNIVDLSKIEAGFYKLNLSNNNIVEVVEEIVMSVTTFTDSKDLNIIFDTDVEEKIIACDTEKIERIVLNLISNAIKFSDKGDEILVDIKDKNEFVEISVKDNGVGIEPEYLDMIFDRFNQVDKSLSRNAEGTGIGLSLVKSIVELHGGSINVESEFGKGSKFTVIIPSAKVLHENNIYSSKVKNGNESIKVELSDVYSS
ncbi:ATP-binding protein [Clostridium sp. FP1]|uniref:ATP-binding protein n=1 Tax=Clostridium sp. FP1 TaxID=2724076 RepID=UPI0013E94CBD|nr:ATP-binding protein [Clostridium sp. FP1]MBZ9636277.1 PAS domain-containing protein [Clostridium sp. FP1]